MGNSKSQTMGGTAGKLYKAIKNPDDAKALKKAFEGYDKDGNGVLDRAELRKFGEDCTKFVKKDLKKESFMVKLMARGMMVVMDENDFIDWCIREADIDGN